MGGEGNRGRAAQPLCPDTARRSGLGPQGPTVGPHPHFLGVARLRWGATRRSRRTASGQEKGNGPLGVGVRGVELHCGVMELAGDGHSAACRVASSRCGKPGAGGRALSRGRKSPPGPVLMLEENNMQSAKPNFPRLSVGFSHRVEGNECLY